LTNYRYAVIDEFGGVMRKFASKTEAQPYLTAGTKLVALPKQPKAEPYQVAMLTLAEALI
jgi:hypothetical protein